MHLTSLQGYKFFPQFLVKLCTPALTGQGSNDTLAFAYNIFQPNQITTDQVELALGFLAFLAESQHPGRGLQKVMQVAAHDGGKFGSVKYRVETASGSPAAKDRLDILKPALLAVDLKARLAGSVVAPA
ncbi:hypothetical protein ES703_20135 [subsurface metagenome]